MSKSNSLNEDGFAPIIVSIVLIVVLSLLTIGFVTLSNANLKNALNTQLNNDAYYAAESGVNDAVKAIANGFNGDKTTCGVIPGNPYLDNSQVGTNTKYTCLLINQNPGNLQYSNVSATQPTVVVLDGVNSAGANESITSLRVSWEPSPQVEPSPYAFVTNGNWLNSCNKGPCFLPEAQWNNNGKPITGVLRIALTPLSTGALPTDTGGTYTSFLYPEAGGGGSTATVNGGNVGANSGIVTSGACSNNATYADACSVDLNLNFSATSSEILLSMESIYDNSRVTIQAYHNGTPLDFKNAQDVIDSTGYDQGVLKRIQVRVSTTNTNGLPAYDNASSAQLCKDLSTAPRNNFTHTPGIAISSCKDSAL